MAVQSGTRNNLDAKQKAALAEMWLRLHAIFSKDNDFVLSTLEIAQICQLDIAKVKNAQTSRTSNAVEPSEISSADPAYEIHAKDITIAQLRHEWSFVIQGDHPDAMLLRFLRARKFDVVKALSMLLHALVWRFQHKVEHLLEHGDSILNLGMLDGRKIVVGGQDQAGHPIVYINAAKHITSMYDQKSKEMAVLWTIENLRATMKTGIESVIIVFNITGLGLKNMDLDLVRFMINTLQNYYPESMHACLILNAPWLFGGFWKIIRPLLDPVVIQKVHFINTSQFEPFISKDQVPECVDGGSKPFPFVFTPPTESNIAAHKTKLEDKQTRAKLLEERLNALDHFQTVAVKWANAVIEGKSDQLLQDLNEEKEQIVSQEISPRWFTYQQATRFPSYFHRVGSMSMAENGIDWNNATC